VLRASFRLAPWHSTRSCDLPEDTTRDTSDQLLPPKRSTCTRTSCVPGSLRDFHRVDTSRSLGLRGVDRGTECFTTLEDASADRSWPRTALPRILVPDIPTRGFRAWAFSSHGACLPIEPLTPLSPLPLARDPERLRVSFVALALASRIALSREEAAKAAVTTVSCQEMARDNLRCLPPSRTLRRIRWPLQPRFRDRRTAFRRV